jgi:hypothetical protein
MTVPLDPGGPAAFIGLVSGVLALRPESFVVLRSPEMPGPSGLWIVLLAGLSQSIGHAFILFVNQVRPLRFAVSLLLEALMFVLGFLTWASSAWLVAAIGFDLPVPLPVVLRALAVAHAPQLFAFLGALPHLGSPLLSLLSLWTAVAFVVGLGAVTGLGPWGSFVCLGGGWLVAHGVQRTAGRPLMRLGRWLLDRAAGVPMVRGGRSLETLLEDRPPGSGAGR